MAKIDLSGLTIPDLHQLQKDAEARIEEIRAEQTQEARAQLEKLAEELSAKTGLPKRALLANIGKSSRKAGRVAPKYKNPNTGETWAGRGKKPAWVKEHLGQGGKLEELAV